MAKLEIQITAAAQKQITQKRRKINKINRYLGIGFALIEGYIYSIMFMGKTGTCL